MTYKLKSTSLRIPDSEIERIITNLKVTKEEAIRIWLEDEGYLKNEEQEELERKAKKNRITATIHQAKTDAPRKTQKERVQKEDPTKENLINEVSNLLKNLGCENVTITNKSKTIQFTIKTDNYEFNLVRHRKPKETS